MAEFQVVMAQAKRMCETVNECEECPMDGDCVFDIPNDPHYDHDIGKMGEIIMKWASEHPAPVYPTWEEWQDENFPDSTERICFGCFGKCDKVDGVLNRCCDFVDNYCVKQPIPADIAEKLGIKPKEAEE